MLLIGFAGLIGGSELLVSGATHIAKAAGIDETTVGITMVAFGTSLPELATSITAGKKGKTGMLVGGILGSNIANIAVVLGTVAAMWPIIVDYQLVVYQIPVMVAFSFMLWLFIANQQVSRWQGWILLSSYALFASSLFL